MVFNSATNNNNFFFFFLIIMVSLNFCSLFNSLISLRKRNNYNTYNDDSFLCRQSSRDNPRQLIEKNYNNKS